MATLYARRGVEVAVIAIESWPGGVIVRLAGLPNEHTEALDRTYHAELEAWAQSGRKDSPPNQPAEDVFDASLTLSDDVGTRYALRTASLGGSGRMFRAEWSFEPGPPDSAARLKIGVIREGENQASIAVDL